MKFAGSYAFTRQVAGRERQIEVEASLLNAWWGDGVGPQTAEDPVGAYLRTMDKMIFLQIAERSTDANGSLPIKLTLADWEGEMDAEFGGLMGPMQ